MKVERDQPHNCIENRRYRTKYGDYTDSHGIQAVQDTILASADSFIYASGIDIRGYVATSHKKYAEAPTGDLEHDRSVSRGKRKYDQSTGLLDHCCMIRTTKSRHTSPA